MKRILVLTHGKFAEGIADSARMIAGQQSITTLCMLEEDSPQEIEGKLVKRIEEADPSDTFIIITDIPGGSTTRAAMPLMLAYENVYVVTGLNLAMLLEIALADEEADATEMINDAIESAHASIINLNEMAKQAK